MMVLILCVISVCWVGCIMCMARFMFLCSRLVDWLDSISLIIMFGCCF